MFGESGQAGPSTFKPRSQHPETQTGDPQSKNTLKQFQNGRDAVKQKRSGSEEATVLLAILVIGVAHLEAQLLGGALKTLWLKRLREITCQRDTQQKRSSFNIR
jgi:hypothetical protein